MSKLFQAIRGMNDILPQDMAAWQAMELLFAQLMRQYGYQEIRFPLLESTALFKRSIGEVTDIVEKEMYTFIDLNGDSLTLRPEGTASCVRACLEHGLLHNATQRLWYLGPMFRHEKPQKGRYRQFYQLGIEAFGFLGVDAELEMIALSARLWKALGIASHVDLEINTLGSLEERHIYKNALTEFLKSNHTQLDRDSLKRLDTNPLRILDSKNPQTQALLSDAPKLYDALGEASRSRFQALLNGLDQLGISWRVNSNLVRGLDYYSHTVFEWTTDKLGAQATICAGGRYDALLTHLGGAEMPAFGLAIGVERVLLLLQSLAVEIPHPASFILCIITSDPLSTQKGLCVAEQLRDHFPQWQILTNTVGTGFKSQFKRADKLGADFALIIGDDEMMHQTVSIKNLKAQKDQTTIPESDLISYLQEHACPYT